MKVNEIYKLRKYMFKKCSCKKGYIKENNTLKEVYISHCYAIDGCLELVFEIDGKGSSAPASQIEIYPVDLYKLEKLIEKSIK